MNQVPEQLVVDASVAVKWHIPDETDAATALTLLNQFLRGEVRLSAPLHIRYEVASAITVATRATPRGRQQPRLSPSEASLALTDFVNIALPVTDDDALILSAFEVAQQYGCAFYDSLYLALAQRLGVRFILADRRFYDLIRHLPLVVWLGDFDAGAV